MLQPSNKSITVMRTSLAYSGAVKCLGTRRPFMVWMLVCDLSCDVAIQQAAGY